MENNNIIEIIVLIIIISIIKIKISTSVNSFTFHFPEYKQPDISVDFFIMLTFGQIDRQPDSQLDKQTDRLISRKMQTLPSLCRQVKFCYTPF